MQRVQQGRNRDDTMGPDLRTKQEFSATRNWFWDPTGQGGGGGAGGGRRGKREAGEGSGRETEEY